jgi:hypothetical protein
MPAELSIRHTDISVGKGVTGKSAIPYETAQQRSARTEFPVLAFPRPFSCFYAALQRHTSIRTSALRMATQFPARDTCLLAFPPAHRFPCSLFSARLRPFVFPLAFPPAHRFPRSLFSARPHPLAISCAPACRLALPPPPHASSSASCFLLHLALPLRLALPSASPPSASPHRQSRARRRTR